MRVAIMQPYLFPYLGYFQLLNAADTFVLLDDAQFTNRGWINRNRLLVNGQLFRFTLPVRQGPRERSIRATQVQPDPRHTTKLLAAITQNYRAAPGFRPVLDLCQRVLLAPEPNLADRLELSLREVMDHVGLTTPLLRSSALALAPKLRAQDRILAICRQLDATHYLNLPGGETLYSRPAFAAQGVELCFLQPVLEPYAQFSLPFVPSLSILDLLLHTSPAEALRHCRHGFLS